MNKGLFMNNLSRLILLFAVLGNTIFPDDYLNLTQKNRNDAFVRGFDAALLKFKKAVKKNDSDLDVLMAMKTSGLISKEYKAAFLSFLASNIYFADSIDIRIENFAKKRLCNALLFPDFDAPIDIGNEKGTSPSSVNGIKNIWNDLRIRLLGGFLEILLEAKIGCSWTYNVILEKIKSQIDQAQRVNPKNNSILILLDFYQKAQKKIEK